MRLQGGPTPLSLFGSSVVLRLATVCLGFVNSIAINRYLGVELRGEYTALLNYANLLQMFLNLGIGNAYPAFWKVNKVKAKGLFIKLSLSQFIAYSLIVCMIGLITSDSSITAIAIIATVMVIENQITFIALVEDVVKRNKILLVTSLLYSLVLIAIATLFSQSLTLIVVVTILNAVINTASLFFVCVKDNNQRNSIALTDVLNILRISIPTMLVNVLMFCNYNIDILLLDIMTHDAAQIGLYGTAVFLGNIVWKIPDAVKEVLYSRAAREDNPREVLWCIAVNCFIAIVILLVFVFVGKQALDFFYGPDFVPAYRLVLLLFAGTVPMIFYKMIHPLYIANRKPGVIVGILSISVAVNIAGNLLLIPACSALGAAIASVVSYSICGLVFLGKFLADYRTSLN